MRTALVNFSIILPPALMLLLVTGCAFTKTTVTFTPQAPTFAEKPDVHTAIKVNRLADVRGSDPFLLGQKGAGTKTSGSYVTDRETADILTDALTETLANLGYVTNANAAAALSLSGDILRFDTQAIVGFFSGDMESTLQISLKLTETNTGNQIWSAVLSGYSKHGGIQIDNAGSRTKAAQGAITDAMTKLASSPDFRNAVQRSPNHA